MRFNLRQMEVFRAVMIAGSMSGAARMLNVSQPAVSRIVAYTEQSLGLALFRRVNGRLMPTAEARQLIIEVDKLHDGARQINELARELASRPGGTLSIAASPSLSIHFIPALIARFLRAYPGVHVRYHTTLLADMPRELLGRKANLAISVLPLDHPDLLSEPFAQGRMICVMPRDHPLAGVQNPSLKDLSAHPAIMYDRAIPFGRMISRAFEEAGLKANLVMEVPRAELAIAMVRAGIGFAIVDEFALGATPPEGTVARPLAEPLHMTLSLLQSRYEPVLDHSAKVFIDMLRADMKSRQTLQS